jgi:HD-GYP domain-containing protein (c-di-GMP phosphodiesterase class II)
MGALDEGMAGPDDEDDPRTPPVDTVTGLGGPDALLSALDLAIEVGAPEQRTVTVVLLDIELGGRPGDERADAHANRAIAGAIATACRREGDTLFRVGPQRFAAVLPGASAEAGRSVAKRAVNGIDAAGIEVDVWAGVAEWPFDGATSEELFDAAHPAFEVTADPPQVPVDGTKRRSAELRSANAVAATVVQRAPWLDGHADRVARLAREVGQMLSLDGDAIDALDVAAQLHDIGMVSLPDAVLLRPKPLEPAGWEAVKGTLEAGARMVHGFSTLGHVAPVIRSHRERWDGTGYPDGLAGEAIPLASRVIGACEAYDAMVSVRPYREPLASSAARRALGDEAGTHFDPAVVAALDRVLDRHRTGTPITTNSVVHRATA